MRILLLTLVILLCGCATPPQLDEIVIGPDHEVKNVHKTWPQLPQDIKRVAVMPLTGSPTQPQTAQGREYFDEALRVELDKLGRAEMAHLTREQVKLWSGRESWRADEVLPSTLVTKVASEMDAQAILFVHLASYHAYPPLTIGWRMRLVRADTRETLWALDEVFDAGQEPVANSARRFAKNRAPTTPSLADSRTALISPSLFARYTLCASLATLPAR